MREPLACRSASAKSASVSGFACRTFWGYTCDPSIPPEEFLGPSGLKLETELQMSSRGLPHQRRNHPHHHFGQLTRTMSEFCREETRTMVWVSFSLQIYSTLSSGGSNSPWSEFRSEFPHFMGMGVVPAPSTSGPGLQKVKDGVEKSRKSWKRVEISIFRLFFDSVFNFLGGRPRGLIFNSVSNLGRRAQEELLWGIEGSQV